MIVGIKGLIGSGKTTISKLIAKEYNGTIFNCDEYVHWVYENDEDIIKKINKKFEMDGSVVNRKKLGEIVFNNAEKLQELEEIILPIVHEKINSLEDNFILLDCPTIDKLPGVKVDVYIVCVVSRDTLVTRIMDRDGRTKEEANKIIDIQDTGYMAKTRTYTIDTSMDEEKIKKSIRTIIGSVDANTNWKDC